MTEMVVLAGIAAVVWTVGATRRWHRRWDEDFLHPERLQKLRDEVEGRRWHERK